MTIISLLAAAQPSGHLNPVKLFLDADIVVQAVIAGLLIASVWVWTNVFAFALRVAGVRRRCDAYEKDFWSAGNFDAFQAERGKGDVPSAQIAAAGLAEWKRSQRGTDREGARQRIGAALSGAVAAETDRLAEPLNFMATVGSVAPFVGLFGTVWGIMNSFFQIGQQQNSSLSVVAPGISEALFATAIGLFAAIPAVIAYNRFSFRVGAVEARLQRFADRFHAALCRDLEGG
jgi:biopolymer transport protein TolQ